MNVKKAIKRIAALAAGTTMVTATIMGAMAYDLGDYPEPFVKDGVFDGKIVVGKTAQVSDVIGAIDVAASLQAAAKTPVSTTGASTSVSVDGGVEISSNSNDLNFGEGLSIKPDFDDDDFEDLLADGTAKTKSSTTYDYEQSIVFNDQGAVIDYIQDEAYGDDPVFAMDISGEEVKFALEFDSSDELPVDIDGATSVNIDMFGVTYTMTADSYDSGSDELTLYGSDRTIYIQKGEPITVEVDGEEFELEIMGGTSDGGSAGGTVNLRVTGDKTEVKSLEEGENEEVANLKVYVDDIIASTIGEETIAATLFIGSNELVLPTDARDDIEWDNDDDTGIQAYADVTGTDLYSIEFYFPVAEFENEAIEDDWEYLVMGESFEMPLFGYSLEFAAMTPGIDGRNMVEVKNSGSVVSINFETVEGDYYSLDLFEDSDTDLVFDDTDFQYIVPNANDMSKGNIFVLESKEVYEGESTTYIFEANDVDDVDGVELKDLITGTEKYYQDGDEVADTNVTIDLVDETLDVFSLSEDTLAHVITAGGLKVAWDDVGATADITFTEDSEDGYRVKGTNSFTITVDADTTSDIKLGDVTGANVTADSDEENENLYGITDYGTWFEQETDDDKYVKVYYAEDEVIFNVLMNGPDAVVVTSTSDAGVAYNVNNFVVGQIAVYDDEAMSLLGSTPVIVVGGPCVNTVAADLMGNPEVCYEGFTDGKAKIKLFESQNALMVAGLSGEDTTGAAQVLAAYDTYDLSGDEVEVITTDLTDLEVNVVE